MYRLEAEFPNGTRASLQRDSAIWVATFASFQFVIRPGETADFEDRARLWVEGNVAGVSLPIALATIRQFSNMVSAVDQALEASIEAEHRRVRA